MSRARSSASPSLSVVPVLRLLALESVVSIPGPRSFALPSDVFMPGLGLPVFLFSSAMLVSELLALMFVMPMPKYGLSSRLFSI